MTSVRTAMFKFFVMDVLAAANAVKNKRADRESFLLAAAVETLIANCLRNPKIRCTLCKEELLKVPGGFICGLPLDLPTDGEPVKSPASMVCTSCATKPGWQQAIAAQINEIYGKSITNDGPARSQ